MNEIKCAVCIPTYKRPENLNMLLASILAMNDSRVSKVVVGITGAEEDSIDETTKQIREAYSLAGKTVLTYSNLSGICGAKKMLKEACSEEVLLICDDDCIFDESYLQLLGWFRMKSIGAVSGSLQTPLNVAGYKQWSNEVLVVPDDLDHCNTLKMTDGKLDWSDKYQVYMVRTEKGYAPVLRAEYLIGSCLFVRREALDIDMLFEQGACAGEEIDFTHKMFVDGYDLIFDASKVAWHMHSMRGGNRAVDRSHDDKTMSYLVQKWGLGNEVKGETVYE